MALDVIHSLIVDLPDGMVDRIEVLETVDHELNKPLGAVDSDAVVEYEREHWGMSREAQESEIRFGELNMPTYGEESALP